MQNTNLKEINNYLLKITQNLDKSTHDWQSDTDFLRLFEAPRINRILSIIQMHKRENLECLEVGFLNGLTPKTITHFIKNAHFDVLERPECQIFTDKIAQERLKNKRIHLIPADLNDLINHKISIKKKYDVIILGEVIEHLDPSMTLNVLTYFNQNLLAKDGKLVITTPNLMCFWFRIRLLFGRQISVPPIKDHIMGMGHINIWSNKNLTETLSHTNYTINSVHYQNGMYEWDFKKIPRNPLSFEFYFVIINLLCKMVYYIFPKTGWTQIISATKKKELP